MSKKIIEVVVDLWDPIQQIVIIMILVVMFATAFARPASGTPYYNATTLGGPADSSTVFMSGDYRGNDPKNRTESVSSTANPGLSFRTVRTTSLEDTLPNKAWDPRNPHGRWVTAERNLAPDQMEENPSEMGTLIFSEEIFLNGDGTYTFEGEFIFGTDGTWTELYINGKKIEVDMSKCTGGKVGCVVDLAPYMEIGTNTFEIRTNGKRVNWAGIVNLKLPAEIPEPSTVQLFTAPVFVLFVYTLRRKKR